MNVKDYLEQYYEDCIFRKRLSPKTMKAYKTDLNQYFEFNETSFYDSKQINEYIHDLNKKYSKYKTIKRKIASIKAFYAYLEYEQIIENSPFKKIRTSIKEPKTLPRVISKNHLKEIFTTLTHEYEYAKTPFQKKMALRNLILLELLFSTGIRISELCNIQIDDINLKERTLRILGKGAKERILYIGNDEVIQRLEKYLELNKTSTYLFTNRIHSKLSDQSVRIILKNIENKLALPLHITPHMFRHTFATTLLEKDVDIRYIQHILGHSSISTTQIYTHVTYTKQIDILSNKNPMNDYPISIK